MGLTVLAAVIIIFAAGLVAGFSSRRLRNPALWLALFIFADAFSVASLPFPTILVWPVLVVFGAGIAVATLAGKRAHPLFRVFSDTWPWLVLFAFLALSLLWAPAAAYGLNQLSEGLGRGLLPGLIVYFLLLSSRRTEWGSFLLLGAIYCLVMILFGSSSQQYGGRLATETLNPIWISRAALLVTSVAIWTKGRIKLRLFAGSLSVILAAQTGSRGPALAFVLANAIIMFLSESRQEAARRVGYAVLVAASILTLTMIGLGVVPSSIEGVGRIESLTSPGKLAEDENVLARFDYWGDALHLAATNPVAGVGLGGFGLSLSSNPFAVQYPHNLPLQILAEAGIVGFGLLILSLVRSFGSARRDSLMLLLVLQGLLYSMYSGNFGSNYQCAFFAVAALAFRHVAAFTPTSRGNRRSIADLEPSLQ
jgi:O-antigen ligase